MDTKLVCRYGSSPRAGYMPVICILAALLVLLPGRVGAVPAAPVAVEVTQPDGSTLTVTLRGDEHRHWHEDALGFPVTKSKPSGFWVYARQQGDMLAETGLVAGKADPVRAGLSRVNAHALSYRQQGPSLPARASRTGTMRNLVVLVAFSDTPADFPRANYEPLFNGTGYTTDGAVGSVQDYYHEVSYNALTVQSTVAEWVALDHGYAYYGANDIWGNDMRPREMVRDALAKLEANGFDFSTVDGNGDGWVDGLTIIHAGGGEEYSGNDPSYIWSHSWSLQDVVTYDGVSMQSYHTEPARRGWDGYPDTQGITRIGVICHETGHFLGLPDLYDYGYDSYGAGNFCLMAGGSWNGSYGTSPSHPSAWCKQEMGWLTPTVVSSWGTYGLNRVETNQEVCKLRGAFPANEYFLIENRQGVGFDAGLPGSARGILIWHIDDNAWNNDDQTHYKVDLEEASGTQHLALNKSEGDDLDYFRSGNATQFSRSTSPNSNSYTGLGLGMQVSSVSASADLMTFQVSAEVHSPVANADGYATAQGVTLNVAAPGVLGNDTDLDNSPLSAALVTNAAHGTVTLSSNGAFVYIPVTGYSGTDTFTYRATDGARSSNTATVTITITPSNQQPVAVNDSTTTNAGKTVRIDVLANDYDPDHDPLSIIAAGPASHGSTSINRKTGVISYTPARGYHGDDSFPYTLSDGRGGTAIGTVTVTIR